MRNAYFGVGVAVGLAVMTAACGGSGSQTLTPTAPSSSAATTASGTTASQSSSTTSAPSSSPAPAAVDVLFGCELTDHLGFVICIHDHINPTDPASVFEVTKRVAWGLRSEGAGLLIKNEGGNVVQWHGYNFSAGRIVFPDGSVVKVITDVGEGGANGASWTDNGFIDPSLYVAAIDPAK